MADESAIKRNGRHGEQEIAGLHPASVSSVAEFGEEPGEPVDELAQIPRLGPVRRQALAGAGIATLDDLRRLSLEQLAAIKYVGIGNARLIKNWLEKYDADAVAEMPPAPSDGLEAALAPEADTAMPPAPPRCLTLPADGPDGLHHGDEVVAPETAIPNQIAYDDLGKIDVAVAQIKRANPKKSRQPKLSKQLSKVVDSMANVPENLDMLTSDGHAEVAGTLEDIAKLLDDAVQGGKLKARKQEKFGAKLKKLRRRLDEIVGA